MMTIYPIVIARLFNKFTPCKNDEEVVAVLAHELGHWKLNHTDFDGIFQEENLSAMNIDPWYSAYHRSHPPLVQRLAAIGDVDKKAD
ncbi:putative ste24 endopeptidase [Rosa chinensis]|uniref:Putative ste24 endopeptidase n=1 Tax=Rosa chinensis TaxID=74649 RepID=A0A2P6SHS7_ROSCH|nr:putative ste24 endopeptidase [Rosa chinensis]